MIPGFISILLGASFANSIYNSSGVIPVNSTFFSDQQKQKISSERAIDSRIPSCITLILSGAIQILVGLFILNK